MIADFDCLSEQISDAESFITAQMSEQTAMLTWLKVALSIETEGVSSAPGQDTVQLLFPGNIPVLTEIKIALDLQQRLALGKDSEFMKRASSLMKPIYYQYYLQLLYLKARNGEDVANALKQALAAHPDFWRSHLYYGVLTDAGSQQLMQKSLEDWLLQLTEEQAKQYRAAYLGQ